MQENTQKKTNSDTYSQAEDAALKAAAIYFGDTLFPYLGIKEKPLGIALNLKVPALHWMI